MYYRQPRYFSDFKCIGSDCTVNCCFGWNIEWSKEEIDKVKNDPNCSAELKNIMETGFISEDGEKHFSVKLLEDGNCPCQTEDGLCMIQKELGAEYLSRTCTIYPRYDTFIAPHKVIYRGCCLSCKEIVKKLINDEKAAEFVNVPVKDDPSKMILLHSNTPEDISAHPELKYRSDILEFFYELIGDKKCSVETNITVGALIAYKLTDLIGNKEYDRIPEALNSFRKQVHYAAGLKNIDSMEPNYDLKLGVVDKINERGLSFNLINILKNKDGLYVVDLYRDGEAKLNEMMKDKPFWLRNIALNMIQELGIPFHSKDHSIFENYRFFAAAFTCMKINAIAAAVTPEETEFRTKKMTLHLNGIDKIYGLTGLISRRLFQNSKSFEGTNNVLNEFEINSPVHLAMLVK